MLYVLFEAVLLNHRVRLYGDTTFTYLQLTLLLQGWAMLIMVGGVDERSGARLGSNERGRGRDVFVRMFTCMRAVEQGNTTPVSLQEIGIMETGSFSDKYRPRDEPRRVGGSYGRWRDC
jgi:hypothetical protein